MPNIKAFAITTIHRRPDPEKDVEVVEAKSIFLTDEAEFDDLKKLGAARKATRAEIAVANAGDDDDDDDGNDNGEGTKPARGRGGRRAAAAPEGSEGGQPPVDLG